MFRNSTPTPLRGTTGRILAHAGTTDGGHLAVTTTALVLARPGAELVETPWHTVRSGTWDREVMRLAWTAGTDEHEALLSDDAPDLVRAFHERVGASVVVSRSVSVPGGSVVIAVRKNLATRELLEQIDPTGAVDLHEPATAATVGAARADVLDQVGLPL